MYTPLEGETPGDDTFFISEVLFSFPEKTLLNCAFFPPRGNEMKMSQSQRSFISSTTGAHICGQSAYQAHSESEYHLTSELAQPFKGCHTTIKSSSLPTTKQFQGTTWRIWSTFQKRWTSLHQTGTIAFFSPPLNLTDQNQCSNCQFLPAPFGFSLVSLSLSLFFLKLFPTPSCEKE